MIIVSGKSKYPFPVVVRVFAPSGELERQYQATDLQLKHQYGRLP